ncbi:MAG: S41 family peptidase [Bacteroidales bacterium]|jgi:carboxyl-terminal processing protease|nr:S41 family peptidase [Bacteroidales bacterium]
MSQKTKSYIPLIIAIALCIGYILCLFINNAPLRNAHFIYKNNNREIDKFERIKYLIENKYVDEVDINHLEEIAIVSMLDSLDPHSTYISAEDLRASQESIKGNFEGIGVQFRIESDTVFIVNTIPNGPSEKMGIQAGDRIITVNDSLIAGVGITNAKVMKLLKGPKGTSVRVGIHRRNVDELLHFEIIRNVIDSKSVDVAYMIDNSLGYVRVSSFSLKTGDELHAALKRLKNQGMTELILDLRGNGGGALRSAVEVSSEFFERKTLIVYTEGTHSPRNNLYSFGGGQFINDKLVVLVDESSASASEIVAGAIQDHDRGTIVGRRTFGKGLVQEHIELPDQSAIHLTVSRYYTPSGRSIQRSYSGGKDEYYADFLDRYISGELISADSIHSFDTTQKYFTSSGRVVYGGGGINPDVFVPITNLKDKEFYYQLINKSIIFRFAFDYTDKHRKELIDKYIDPQGFIKEFNVTEKMLFELLSESEKKNITFDKQGYDAAKNEIKILIKAYIGRNLFDDEAFYPIYNQMDNDVIESIKVVKE